jgi:chromosomal replication initiation ATPase DnaA
MKVTDPVLQIKMDVCRDAGITLRLLLVGDGLRGQRSRLTQRPRLLAASRMRNELGMSYPEIGEALNRHHTTIITLLNGPRHRTHVARREDRQRIAGAR